MRKTTREYLRKIEASVLELFKICLNRNVFGVICDSDLITFREIDVPFRSVSFIFIHDDLSQKFHYNQYFIIIVCDGLNGRIHQVSNLKINIKL